MAVRPVIEIGNPLLRQVARDLTPEEIGSEWLRELVVDMVETMHAEDGIGLAASQIGELVQVAVVEFSDDSERYPEMGGLPLTVFINPRITVLDETEQEHWEGCLSVPNLRGLVPRPRAVQIDFFDLLGEPMRIEADDFLATVLQHELDHLQGVLFVDRIRDMTKLATIEQYLQHWAEDDEEDADEAEPALD
jgi:peptide deformylase